MKKEQGFSLIELLIVVAIIAIIAAIAVPSMLRPEWPLTNPAPSRAAAQSDRQRSPIPPLTTKAMQRSPICRQAASLIVDSQVQMVSMATTMPMLP